MEFLNYQAETSVLKLMMDGHTDDVMDLVDIKMMQSKEGTALYRRIAGISWAKKVTPYAVREAYEDDEQMLAFINVCLNKTTNIHELEDLERTLAESFARKKSFDHAQKIMDRINADVTDLKMIAGVGVDFNDVEKIADFIDPHEGAKEYFEQLMEDVKNPEGRGRLKIKCLPQLHNTINGIDKTDLIMMCAKSGKGKTAFALTLASDLAIKQGKTVLYLNCEMSPTQLLDRMSSTMTEIDLTEIDARIFTGDEKVRMDKILRISDAVDVIGKSKLYFSHTPTITPRHIKRAYKKLELSGHKPDIIFVDYIAYMDLEKSTTGKQEHQILYENALACKQLANQLNVPFVALAQLNAYGQIEGSKKIINASDAVFYIHEMTREVDDSLTDNEKKRAQAEIDREMNSMSSNQLSRANYKISKEKVRRGDPSRPIYIRFNKIRMEVTEIE